MPVSDPGLKPLVLINLLRQELIVNHCLVFTKSNESAVRLSALLSILDSNLKRVLNPTPYKIGVVTGELDMVQRRRALLKFTQGEIDMYAALY